MAFLLGMPTLSAKSFESNNCADTLPRLCHKLAHRPEHPVLAQFRLWVPTFQFIERGNLVLSIRLQAQLQFPGDFIEAGEAFLRNARQVRRIHRSLSTEQYTG